MDGATGPFKSLATMPTHPVDAECKDTVDNEPDRAERNCHEVSHVEPCTAVKRPLVTHLFTGD